MSVLKSNTSVMQYAKGGVGDFAYDDNFEFNIDSLTDVFSFKMTPYSLKLISAIRCYKCHFFCVPLLHHNYTGMLL